MPVIKNNGKPGEQNCGLVPCSVCMRDCIRNVSWGKHLICCRTKYEAPWGTLGQGTAMPLKTRLLYSHRKEQGEHWKCDCSIHKNTRSQAQSIGVMLALRKGNCWKMFNWLVTIRDYTASTTCVQGEKTWKFHRPVDGFGTCSIPEHSSIFWRVGNPTQNSHRLNDG